MKKNTYASYRFGKQSGHRSSTKKSGPFTLKITLKKMVAIVLASNLVFFFMFSTKTDEPEFHRKEKKPLYLWTTAATHVQQPENFRRSIENISMELDVPASWLMAVIAAESSFNPQAVNHKGSGAVGLIQFMPQTAQELGVEHAHLLQMNATQQLAYVGQYLKLVESRYGSFQNLVDLYLAILYPKAINQDPCYALYFQPSKKYRQNAGLDENKDGVVTVSDIDRRLARKFPEAWRERAGEREDLKRDIL